MKPIPSRTNITEESYIKEIKITGNYPKDIKQMNKYSRKSTREFPGGPVVRTQRFHCHGHGFNPWSKIPQAARGSNK